MACVLALAWEQLCDTGQVASPSEPLTGPLETGTQQAPCRSLAALPRHLACWRLPSAPEPSAATEGHLARAQRRLSGPGSQLPREQPLADDQQEPVTNTWLSRPGCQCRHAGVHGGNLLVTHGPWSPRLSRAAPPTRGFPRPSPRGSPRPGIPSSCRIPAGGPKEAAGTDTRPTAAFLRRAPASLVKSHPVTVTHLLSAHA